MLGVHSGVSSHWAPDPNRNDLDWIFVSLPLSSPGSGGLLDRESLNVRSLFLSMCLFLFFHLSASQIYTERYRYDVENYMVKKIHLEFFPYLSLNTKGLSRPPPIDFSCVPSFNRIQYFSNFSAQNNYYPRLQTPNLICCAHGQFQGILRVFSGPWIWENSQTCVDMSCLEAKREGGWRKRGLEIQLPPSCPASIMVEKTELYVIYLFRVREVTF